ncbi:hypothetical protein P5V15_015626 [Pogonomyrmex californicus]
MQRTFRVGNRAYLLKEPRKDKLSDQYSGPYKILEILRNNNIKIALRPGKTRIVHLDKLKWSGNRSPIPADPHAAIPRGTRGASLSRLPSLVEIHEPQLATSGIYTPEDLDRFRDHIMFPVEKPSMFNTIARGAMRQEVPKSTVAMINLLDEASDQRKTQAKDSGTDSSRSGRQVLVF